LEIGPDIGLVTRSVIDELKPNKVILIEPNISVHKELLSNSSASADVVLIDNVNDLNNQSPDLIVGVHVYDHLLNPLEELIKLNSKSSNGAKIALVVHNEKSIIRKLLRKKWPPFCLQHPQLYNKKTIKQMLELSHQLRAIKEGIPSVPVPKITVPKITIKKDVEKNSLSFLPSLIVKSNH
jgi:hypothetical protein